MFACGGLLFQAVFCRKTDVKVKSQAIYVSLAQAEKNGNELSKFKNFLKVSQKKFDTMFIKMTGKSMCIGEMYSRKEDNGRVYPDREEDMRKIKIRETENDKDFDC